MASHGHRPCQRPRSHARRRDPRATVILEEGRIAPGFDADLVALDEGLEAAMTFVGGELAFCRPKGSAA